jgi:HD-GYP domain-containing protein (c-di-GMP phosphodiesterase class II)
LPLIRQHPWTRFIRLLDTYDCLTSNLPHRPAQTPFAALKALQERRGTHGAVFDPRAQKAFIKFLALS